MYRSIDIFKATYFTYSVVCFVTWATVDCYIYIFLFLQMHVWMTEHRATFVFAAEMSKLFWNTIAMPLETHLFRKGKIRPLPTPSKTVWPGPWSTLWFRRSSHKLLPCVSLLATQRNRLQSTKENFKWRARFWWPLWTSRKELIDQTWHGQRSRTMCWGVSHLTPHRSPWSSFLSFASQAILRDHVTYLFDQEHFHWNGELLAVSIHVCWSQVTFY